jgi:phage tail sheath protein FI
LGISPALAQIDPRRVLEAQINRFTEEPHGIVCMSEDTLARDPDLISIHVRRLLSLLKRLAFIVGADYVFEPHNDALRRMVQHSFESALDQMYRLGAFVGPTRETAYQVVVDDALNPTPSVDQGRMIVELRVAPAQALQFLTVRLLQSGIRGIVTEGR